MSANVQDPLPMLECITLNDLEPIALGATFLGTGGGGDPYLGRLLTRVALERRAGGYVDVIAPEALNDDAQTAESLTTDDIRYGQRVIVVATSAAACMRTPKALAVFGPHKFGLDEAFIPLEHRLSH